MVAGFVAAFWVLAVTACGSRQPRPTNFELQEAANIGAETQPTSEAEQVVLDRLSKLPSNKPTQVGVSLVLAAPAYQAASNRRCRRVQIGADALTWRPRLACVVVGDTWHFVPDVFEVPLQPSPLTEDAVPPLR
jgi:hypothetical protein